MRIVEVEFDGKGVRVTAPESATLEERMLTSRPRALFREKDGDTIDYDPKTQLVTVTTRSKQKRAIHAARAAWMLPADKDTPIAVSTPLAAIPASSIDAEYEKMMAEARAQTTAG